MTYVLNLRVYAFIIAISASMGCTRSQTAAEKGKAEGRMKGKISYLNPDGLHRNPAFTHVVAVSGNVRTVYVGGQNAVTASGAIVGKGDIGAQAEQIFKNLQTALAAADAKLEHVVKWTVYAVQGHHPGPALAVFGKVWGNRPNPPTISVVTVAGLANPDFLMEIDAIAVVPE